MITTRLPTKSELRAPIEHAGEDLKPLVMTAIFTGLRASKLRGLRWSDIDMKLATITVSQRADKFGEIGPPKPEAGYRTNPIPPAQVTVLRSRSGFLIRGPWVRNPSGAPRFQVLSSVYCSASN